MDSVWFFFSFILLYDHVFFGVRLRAGWVCIGARGGCAPALGDGCAPALGGRNWLLVWSGPVGGGEGQMNQTAGGVGGCRRDELPTDVPEVLEPLQTPPDGTRVPMNPSRD